MTETDAPVANETRQPMTFRQEMMAHAAQKFGGNEQTPDAEPAPAAPVIDPAVAPAPDATEPPVDTNTPPAVAEPAAAPVAPVVEAPNYDQILNEISGGVIPNLDAFKQTLPNLQQFETVSKRNVELEAAIAKDPFASDTVKKFNELVASGAKPDQIEAFFAVNRLGDISEMSSRDAKVNRMVIEGYPRSVAEMKVDKGFNLSDENLLPAEKEILQADLDVSARADREFLSKYKAEVSTIPVAAPEEQTLQQQARVQAHTATVKAAVPQIASQFTGIGARTLTTKVGDDSIEVPVDINYSDAFKAQIPKMLEDYFMDGLTPLTPENIATAQRLVRAQYILSHEDEVINTMVGLVGKKVKEHVDGLYENRSGLEQNQDNPTKPVSADAEFKSMQERVASGRR